MYNSVNGTGTEQPSVVHAHLYSEDRFGVLDYSPLQTSRGLTILPVKTKRKRTIHHTSKYVRYSSTLSLSVPKISLKYCRVPFHCAAQSCRYRRCIYYSSYMGYGKPLDHSVGR